MEKKDYYEFDAVIYPRKLWVLIDNDRCRDVNEWFTGFEGEKLLVEYNIGLASTYISVMEKSTGALGMLVVIYDSYRSDIVLHESVHVCNAIFQQLSIKVDLDNDEPYAYLMSWIGRSILSALNTENLSAIKFSPSAKTKLKKKNK